jgi:hypothetical protein
LQSFPPGFVFHGECVAEQIGNAVPPRLALAIALALRTALADPAPLGPPPAAVPEWIQPVGPGSLPDSTGGVPDQAASAHGCDSQRASEGSGIA